MDRLIVATNYRLMVLDGHDARVVHSSNDIHDAHYYGTTWDDLGIVYVCCEVGGEWWVRTFDRDLRPTGMLPPHDGLSELHQAEWRDGSLAVCSAGKNRLCVWGNREWGDEMWNPAEEDLDHINSVWNGWVVEFRQKGGAPSVIRWGLVELEIGPCIHNVYVEGGWLHTLVGGEDAGILRLNLDTGERELKPFGQRTFVRGLARTKDRWYVGNMLWEHDREKRMDYRGDAQVLVLNNDFELVDEITVPNGGAVAEIRALDVPDLAHNGILL